MLIRFIYYIYNYRLLYYLPMERMTENSLLWQATMEEAYNRITELEEENKKLNIKVASLEWEIKWLNSVVEKLKEENQTLELWLDNKEKLNGGYRKELEKLKSTYVYDAKQVRDIC